MEVLKIQNILVSIYDGQQNESFYNKIRMIRHLFLLLKKSNHANLYEDQQMIEKRLLKEWETIKSYFNTKDSKLLKLDEYYLKIKQLNLNEYEKNKQKYFKYIEEYHWKHLK